MKRFFKAIINWIRNLERFDKVALAIGVVVGLCAGIVLFICTDKVPATASDYEPFEKQVIAAQEDPKLLFEKDCNITVEDGIITANFKNDECEVTAKYNQNFELLSISKENHNNYMAGHWAFVFSIFVGLIMCFVGTLGSFLIMALYIEVLSKRKAKTKSNK